MPIPYLRPAPALIAALAATALAAPALGQQAALPGAVAIKPAEAPGAVAKRAPVNGVLVLYGNERCPTNTDGDEIVICERRGAAEQFRIPKELREFQVTPQNESWAMRAASTLDTGVGASSIGSCSAVGPGGQTGCFAQSARAARRQKQADKAAEPELP